MKTQQKELHLISHTHWDREWYLTFQEFRIKLVDLIDHLLDIMDKDPEYKYFTLDGQTVVLEDYLEIRPENRVRLKKYIKEGRVFIGPWYILPDEFLVSGESIIRNLLLGHRIGAQFGKVMKVGYIPDTFGHISQLPQILSGFGIDNVILWRGIASKKSECLWEAPDGSKVLMIHLGRGGYCNAADLPGEIDKACERIMALKKECEKRASTPYLLLLNGCDHLEPQAELSKIIKGVNERLTNSTLIHSNLPAYIQKIKESNPQLTTLRGEFRKGLSHAYLLTGVISARIYLKQINKRVENLLEKWTEPFSVIFNVLGGENYESLVWQAWKNLLQNHPHDSICGCSIDEVHRQMLTRFSWSEEIGEEIARRSLEGIANFIDTSSLREREEALPIFNPLSWQRCDLVEAEVDFPEGSKERNFRIYDAEGKEIPYQYKIPLNVPIHRRKVYLKAEVPSLGFSLYRISPCSEKVTHPGTLLSKPHVLENEFFRVEIRLNGTLTILDKDTKKVYRNCHLFEDGGDAGDEYNYSYPRVDKVFTTIRERPKISLVEDGPIKATYSIEYNWQIPKEISKDRKKRSEAKVKLHIQSLISLIKGVKRVEIETRVHNTAKDHRLRVLFPSGIKTKFSWAEAQFDIVKREIRVPSKRKGDREEPSPTHPQQSFVDVNDGRNGLCLANQGLPEYEVRDDEKRTIALTLLRVVGYLSRPDLLTRHGNAGPFIATPQAQCPGNHVFRYAIIPHRGIWQDGRVLQEAHNFAISLRPFQFTRLDLAKREFCLPKEHAFIEVEPEEIVVTTLKKKEEGQGLIVRLFNTGSKEIKAGRLSFFREIREAFEVNLAEEKIKGLAIENQYIINFNLRSRGLITFLIHC